MTPDPIRVLIAEDSPTVRRYLVDMINTAGTMRVVGEARDGDEALVLTEELKPDVISMDIRMPVLDGLEATRRIMSRRPTPVVIVSNLLEREVDLSFQALQAGALAVVEKPPHRQDPTFAAKQRHLLTTLQVMSQVRVIRRWEKEPGQNALNEPSTALQELPRVTLGGGRLKITPEIVVIGASAGGPGALSVLLHGLPAYFPVPIVIAQHIPDEFTAGLARWLEKSTVLPVRVAADNVVLEPGVVHLAPGAAHLLVERRGGQLLGRLRAERGAYRYQPSVDVLFESVAAACGTTAVGLILTGMGDDGAAGLLAMRQAGAQTFAQDETSSTVFGMPGAAIAHGAVEQVLALSNLATTLSNLI